MSKMHILFKTIIFFLLVFYVSGAVEYTDSAGRLDPSTIVLDMTLNNLMQRLQ